MFAELTDGDWTVSIDPESAGWSFSGLRVVELAPGQAIDFYTHPDGALVRPRAGAAAAHR